MTHWAWLASIVFHVHTYGHKSTRLWARVRKLISPYKYIQHLINSITCMYSNCTYTLCMTDPHHQIIQCSKEASQGLMGGCKETCMMSSKSGPCWYRGQTPTTSSTGVTSGDTRVLHYTELAGGDTFRLWRRLLHMEPVLIKVMGGITCLHFTMHAWEVIKRWWNTWSRSSDVALVSSRYSCVLIK